MEAPEKIYIIIDPVWGSMCVNYDKNDTNNIEYVRKDSVIEKACRFIKERLSFDDSWHVEGEDCMLDKVIKDFKKYMKE